jgi:hypothetical protein
MNIWSTALLCEGGAPSAFGRIASITKLFTATIIMQMWAVGKIDVDALVAVATIIRPSTTGCLDP